MSSDDELYDDLQRQLIGLLLADIFARLQEAFPETDPLFLEELSEQIGFSIANLLDGKTNDLTYKASSYAPKISFVSNSVDSPKEIGTDGTWMHEYVFGHFDALRYDR